MNVWAVYDRAVGAARQYLVDYQASLNLADAAFANAKGRERDRLERLVRSGTGTEDDLAALVQARVDFANAQTQRAAELTALLDAATAGVTGPHRATLEKLSANAPWKQPIEFHTVDRDQVDWVALREALANERIAAKRQETPDPGAQALLQQLRAGSGREHGTGEPRLEPRRRDRCLGAGGRRVRGAQRAVNGRAGSWTGVPRSAHPPSRVRNRNLNCPFSGRETTRGFARYTCEVFCCTWLTRPYLLNVLVIARCYFRPCSLMIQDLLVAKRDLKLTRVLKRLAGFDVLVLDDLGYVQHDREEMEVLFTLLAERYERGSIMITSNLPFSKWDAIFKDAMTTAAAIDRLVHHSVILELNVGSYRLEKAQATGKEARPRHDRRRSVSSPDSTLRLAASLRPANLR